MLKFQIFVVFYKKMRARFYIFKRMLSKRRTQIQYVDAEHTSANIKRMMSMRRIKKIADIRQNFQNIFYKILICNQTRWIFYGVENSELIFSYTSIEAPTIGIEV
jgi:hypothetical protein